ncbi:MAG: baseplate J/gp47 family protein [Ruminococcus flavefaciens]|nr:baseplate J/gp47 family protein [Ruminococcus flavefaciens]
MAQPEFEAPDFVMNSTAEEIVERMMNNLPDDIDDMPGGFPYDFTMPSAIEKSELINFHLVRALMIAFPQFAWDEWLDYHGQQVGLVRHPGSAASGNLLITGEPETEIEAGTIFCVPAVDDVPAIEYETVEDCVIGEDGKVTITIRAVESGAGSNVPANSVSIMDEPMDEITEITNPEPITGGTAEENDDNFYDRIAAEYENSNTYLGNDNDYKRWAQEAGAGDCIVDSTYDGPGTVRLVLVDTNGQPANDELVETVYNYIVSPKDRSARLLPTACAKLICVPATTIAITYTCTGLVYDETTSLEQIVKEFKALLATAYGTAKSEGVLRYNDVRPLLSTIDGVQDFDTFLINGTMSNIKFQSEEYPETGICEFS